MLMARQSNGEWFSLVGPYERERLIQKRLTQSFFCPVCGEALIMKLGQQKAYHFAHHKHSECMIQSEPETPVHIQGKKDWFEWLSKQGQKPIMEWILSAINQRSDVGLSRFPQAIALEFQCSTLPLEQLLMRDKGYRSQSIQPIWIWNEARLKKVGSSIYHLSSLEITTRRFPFIHPPHHLFQRHKGFITFYNPSTKYVTFLYHLLPLSSSRYWAKTQTLPLNDLSLQDLLTPDLPLTASQEWLPVYLNQKKKWRECLVPRTHYLERDLQRLAATKQLVWKAFPGLVGCPVGDDGVIETPTYIWQGWLYLSFLYNKRIGTRIDLQNVIEAFQKFRTKKWLHVRGVFDEQDAWNRQISSYLRGLCVMGFLKEEEGEGRFVIHKMLDWMEPFSLELFSEDQRVLRNWARQVKL